MKTATKPVMAAAALLLAVSLGVSAFSQERGPAGEWRDRESAMRAAELCDGWTRPKNERRRDGWNTNDLNTGERLHAVDRGRRDAERLVRKHGCESDEVRGLLAFFYEYIQPLFD